MNKPTHFVSSNKEDTYKHSKERVTYTKDYPKYQYLLFDSRARYGGDTMELPVLEVTNKLPKSVPSKYGEDCVWERIEKLDNKKHPTYGKEKLLLNL